MARRVETKITPEGSTVLNRTQATSKGWMDIISLAGCHKIGTINGRRGHWLVSMLDGRCGEFTSKADAVWHAITENALRRYAPRAAAA